MAKPETLNEKTLKAYLNGAAFNAAAQRTTDIFFHTTISQHPYIGIAFKPNINPVEQAEALREMAYLIPGLTVSDLLVRPVKLVNNSQLTIQVALINLTPLIKADLYLPNAQQIQTIAPLKRFRSLFYTSSDVNEMALPLEDLAAPDSISKFVSDIPQLKDPQDFDEQYGSHLPYRAIEAYLKNTKDQEAEQKLASLRTAHLTHMLGLLQAEAKFLENVDHWTPSDHELKALTDLTVTLPAPEDQKTTQQALTDEQKKTVETLQEDIKTLRRNFSVSMRASEGSFTLGRDSFSDSGIATFWIQIAATSIQEKRSWPEYLFISGGRPKDRERLLKEVLHWVLKTGQPIQVMNETPPGSQSDQEKLLSRLLERLYAATTPPQRLAYPVGTKDNRTVTHPPRSVDPLTLFGQVSHAEQQTLLQTLFGDAAQQLKTSLEHELKTVEESEKQLKKLKNEEEILQINIEQIENRINVARDRIKEIRTKQGQLHENIIDFVNKARTRIQLTWGDDVPAKHEKLRGLDQTLHQLADTFYPNRSWLSFSIENKDPVSPRNRFLSQIRASTLSGIKEFQEKRIDYYSQDNRGITASFYDQDLEYWVQRGLTELSQKMPYNEHLIDPLLYLADMTQRLLSIITDIPSQEKINYANQMLDLLSQYVNHVPDTQKSIFYYWMGELNACLANIHETDHAFKQAQQEERLRHIKQAGMAKSGQVATPTIVALRRSDAQAFLTKASTGRPPYPAAPLAQLLCRSVPFKSSEFKSLQDTLEQIRIWNVLPPNQLPKPIEIDAPILLEAKKRGQEVQLPLIQSLTTDRRAYLEVRKRVRESMNAMVQLLLEQASLVEKEKLKEAEKLIPASIKGGLTEQAALKTTAQKLADGTDTRDKTALSELMKSEAGPSLLAAILKTHAYEHFLQERTEAFNIVHHLNHTQESFSLGKWTEQCNILAQLDDNVSKSRTELFEALDALTNKNVLEHVLGPALVNQQEQLLSGGAVNLENLQARP